MRGLRTKELRDNRLTTSCGALIVRAKAAETAVLIIVGAEAPEAAAAEGHDV